jgi:hypothetical protein
MEYMKGSSVKHPIQQPINPTIDPTMATTISARRIRGCFDTIENYIL